MPLSDEQLALKRRLLIHRSAMLRTQWGLQVEALARPVRSATTQAQGAGLWLARHPALAVGLVAALMAGGSALAPRARSLLSAMRLGLRLWQWWQAARKHAPASASTNTPPGDTPNSANRASSPQAP